MLRRQPARGMTAPTWRLRSTVVDVLVVLVFSLLCPLACISFERNNIHSDKRFNVFSNVKPPASDQQGWIRDTSPFHLNRKNSTISSNFGNSRRTTVGNQVQKGHPPRFK